MIDFSLSDEQKQLRELVKEFTTNEIAPVAAEYDRKSEFPKDVIRQAWELGFMNVQIPETYGGAGLGVDLLRAALLARFGDEARAGVHGGARLRRDGREPSQENRAGLGNPERGRSRY